MMPERLWGKGKEIVNSFVLAFIPINISILKLQTSSIEKFAECNQQKFPNVGFLSKVVGSSGRNEIFNGTEGFV